MNQNQGDRYEQFLQRYSRHEQRLRLYVMALVPHREDVDDILQETSIALWRKFDEYQPEHPFLNWACRFAHFQVLSHQKKERTLKKHLCFSQTLIDTLAREQLEHQEMLVAQQGALENCLEALPAPDRQLIEMRYAGDVTVTDLAQQTNSPVKHLYRALERIRRQLADCVQFKLAAEGWL